MKKMLKEYGVCIVIGIDVCDGYVVMEGWVEIFIIKVIELGKELVNVGVEIFIFMDIFIDGMLSGFNVEGIVEMVKVIGKGVIVLGGVSKFVDLDVLKKYEVDGVIGVIVGKVFYINKFIVVEVF